jgi:RNA methyltransferase, TrmH family
MPESDKIITSAQNPAIKDLRSLAVKKYRDETGLFLVEGARHIGEALAGGWDVETLAYSARGAGDPAVAMARQKGHCLEVTDDLLARITGRDNPQPLVAAFRQRRHELPAVKEGLWIGLEGIRDPGNLGTILRTADAVAAAGIILIGETCDPWSPETIRATMGSFSRVPLVAAAAAEFPAWRPGWKGSIVGTHLKTETDYRQGDYKLPLLLLMGSEQSGLSAELAKACDVLVKIPMPGGAESLNLAVSTAVMLYEICRNRI